MKIKRYVVLTCVDLTTLEDWVNDHISEGWQPLGNVTIHTWINQRNFYQTIVKYEEPNGHTD